MKLSIDYDERRSMNIDDSCPPFDGNPVLIKVGCGWTEACWIPAEVAPCHDGDGRSGFCWFSEVSGQEYEVDEPTDWMPLPDTPMHNCKECKFYVQEGQDWGVCHPQHTDRLRIVDMTYRQLTEMFGRTCSDNGGQRYFVGQQDIVCTDFRPK